MIRFIGQDGKPRTVYNVEDFPYKDFTDYDINVKNSRAHEKVNTAYIELIASFDIETTSTPDPDGSGRQIGFMYQWQFALENKVIFGRTWEEFQTLLDNLATAYHTTIKKRLIIYVHNLAYEFQFMRKFLHVLRVFAPHQRRPLSIVTEEGIEFRCSWYLSSMSLDRFCESTPCITAHKLTGTYDYSKIRTPYTELTPLEMEYCYNDVAGLNECIKYKEKSEGDTLATIPLTSTGYVRRICRQSMRKNASNYWAMKQCRLTPAQYIMCMDAFRGGNTAANPNFVGYQVENVWSFDAVSCYPYVMMTKYFPNGKFVPEKIRTMHEFELFLNSHCCLFKVTFTDLKLKAGVPIPYIARHKCDSCKGGVVYNNRVLNAKEVTLTITEIDYDIILEQYDFEHLAIGRFYHCRRGYLPIELRSCIMQFFINKTKNKKGDKYFYQKSKSLLNAIYGMCCTALVHDDIIYDPDGDPWRTNPIIDKNDSHKVMIARVQEKLNEYYASRNNFLTYQWGIWVTAHARAHLQRLIDTNKSGTIYCDTDSDKMIFPDFAAIDALNADIIAEDEKAGAYCDYDGKRYYLGIFENEGMSEKFVTLGAKKYCVVKDGKTQITISGVGKAEGTKELDESGGIDAFKPGFTFRRSAGIEATYNDDEIHKITINGDTFTTASNIGMKDSTYLLSDTTGISDITKKLIDFFTKGAIMET